MPARNDHKSIENSQIHVPKDFAIASDGDTPRRNLNSEFEWSSNPWKLSVLDLADVNAAPPTEVDGDRYILIEVASTVVNSDWDGAAINDIVEYSEAQDNWGNYTPSGGEMLYDQDSGNFYEFDGSDWVVFSSVMKPTLSKTLNIESPTSSEDITFFRSDVAITVQEVIAVSVGSTPSVTYQLKHHTDRDNAGNALTTSGATTSTTTGDTATLSDSTIPANSWIWLESTAQSGTVSMMSVDLRYTED